MLHAYSSCALLRKELKERKAAAAAADAASDMQQCNNAVVASFDELTYSRQQVERRS